jgi:tetratricopeptide (TPR) repeat protein
LSYERLDSEDRVDALAQRLLARASYFAPGEPIPRDLLAATLRLSGEVSARLEAEEALGRLINLGLLEEGEDGRVVMHRLVAWFAKAAGQESEDRRFVEETLFEEANRLNEEGFPGALLGWQPHLRFATEAAFNRDDDIAAKLCSALDCHLSAIGDYMRARPYSERALAIREKILGPEHPATATSLNDLGSLLQDLDDPSGARPYYERALAIREKVLGPEHPDTVWSLNNLGSLLQDLDDRTGARPYYERALAIREKVLGPEHPDTAWSLNNLGSLLQALGDLSGARPYYERALAIREKVLGPEHPDTAWSLNKLGSLLQALGDLSGARPYHERALAIREKVLGPEHPDTAWSLNNLGSFFQNLGNLSGARQYYERALAIFTERLGPDHSRTKFVRKNLETLDALRQTDAGLPRPGSPPT